MWRSRFFSCLVVFVLPITLSSLASNSYCETDDSSISENSLDANRGADRTMISLDVQPSGTTTCNLGELLLGGVEHFDFQLRFPNPIRSAGKVQLSCGCMASSVDIEDDQTLILHLDITVGREAGAKGKNVRINGETSENEPFETSIDIEFEAISGFQLSTKQIGIPADEPTAISIEILDDRFTTADIVGIPSIVGPWVQQSLASSINRVAANVFVSRGELAESVPHTIAIQVRRDGRTVPLELPITLYRKPYFRVMNSMISFKGELSDSYKAVVWFRGIPVSANESSNQSDGSQLRPAKILVSVPTQADPIELYSKPVPVRPNGTAMWKVEVPKKFAEPFGANREIAGKIVLGDLVSDVRLVFLED